MAELHRDKVKSLIYRRYKGVKVGVIQGNLEGKMVH
jgi:hypothetical protein